MAGEKRQPKAAHEATTLLASAARATDSEGSSVRLPVAGAMVFVLDITAAATEAGDTLDVFIQTKLDGTNWLDIVHFTQATGTGGAKRHVAKVVRDVAEAMFENGTALAAGSVRNLLGDEYRVRWDVTDATTTGNISFTFSVQACPM